MKSKNTPAIEKTEPEVILRELGLTEYEIKAWLSLIRHGTLTAEKISDIGGIPLPRVYDTLTELKKKGFVLVSQMRPKRFRAIDTYKALKHYANLQKLDMNKRLSMINGRIQNAVQALQNLEPELVIKEEKQDIWSTEKRTNINRLLDEIKADAKKEILIFSGDLSWIHETKDTVKSILQKGLKLRVLVREPKNQKAVLNNVKIAKQLGVLVRSGYEGPLRCHIVDEKIAAIINKVPKSGQETDTGMPGKDIDFRYEVITIETLAIVKALKENFEFWWARLK